jgi:UDP-3-O-[3-hydroxymyristoyl] glucosamine N-acyltransferase
MDEHKHTNPEDRSLTAGEVADLVDGRCEGDPEIVVRGIAPIDQAEAGDLGFLAARRYVKYLAGTRAQALLVGESQSQAARKIPARVVVPDPHGALPILLAHFFPPREVAPAVHPTAVLGRGVRLGADVSIGPYTVLEEGTQVGDRVRIGPHCCIGRGCRIGDDSLLYPQVVLYPGTQLGARVILHSGVRLGVDGYGYVPGDGVPEKVPQVGECVLEDDVEIGANTCIDRGSIGRTVVGRGTKLDNLVQLAHNVQIGRNVFITAQVGIAGSTRVGNGVMFGGQAGIIGHIEIGDGARIGAQAGVIGDIGPGESVSGYPARNNREYLRGMGLALRLPETIKRIHDLEARLEAVESPRGQEGTGPKG